jgi:hypothetical protein
MKFKSYDVKEEKEIQFISHMVLESIKLLDSYSDRMKYKFLHGFISYLVLSTLKLAPKTPCSVQDLYEFTKNNLLQTKLDIQEAIALGFGEAMTLYSGINVLYDCRLKTIKKPKRILN